MRSMLKSFDSASIPVRQIDIEQFPKNRKLLRALNLVRRQKKRGLHDLTTYKKVTLLKTVQPIFQHMFYYIFHRPSKKSADG